MPLPSDEVGVTILNIVHAGDRVCGYYAAHSADLSGDFRLIKRVSDILNLLASVQLGRVWQRQLEAKLENNLYTDFTAGLPNLKGLSRWYDEYAAEQAHRDRTLSLAVFEANLQINRYDKQAKLYFAQDGEEISLLDLALRRYTALLLRDGNYTQNGEVSHNIDFAIYCADGANAALTVNNIHIKGIEEPTIHLGDRSRLELILNGKNTLDKEGMPSVSA